MKPKLCFYSDCFIFGGCEKMLALLMNSAQLKSFGDFDFVYRFSDEYHADMVTHFKGDVQPQAAHLLSIDSIIHRTPSKLLQRVIACIFHYTPLKYLFVLWNTVVLRRHLAKSAPDILYINNGGYPGAYSCASAAIAAWLCGIKKIVYMVNNKPLDYSTFHRRLDWPLDIIVKRCVTLFLTASKCNSQHLQKMFSLPNNRINYLHNGVALRSVTETRESVFKRLYLPGDVFALVIVARLEKRKGHIVLLRALKNLLQDPLMANLMLLIEGVGPESNRLRQFVVENNLAKHVKFIGHEKNVFNLIHCADLILLPSIANEDFPNVILEAMGLGKSIIATNIAGIPEQIEHMHNGIIVEPNNVDQLAEGIHDLVLDTKLRESLGNHAKQRFTQHFTETAAANRHSKLYASLLDAVIE